MNKGHTLIYSCEWIFFCPLQLLAEMPTVTEWHLALDPDFCTGASWWSADSGTSWQSRGWDSMLPVQKVWVQFLVRELGSHRPLGMACKKKEQGLRPHCMVESALGHIGCETLGKLINLSVPQFPYMRNDTGIVFTYLTEFLWGVNELLCVEYLE